MSWRAWLVAYLRHEARPAHKFSHQPRLYALAQQIATLERLAYDDDVVFAAAYLHDLGVFLGHRPEQPEALAHWDHVAYVCNQAPPLLAQAGFPAHKIPAVLQVIRQHQPQDEPTTAEATLLRDADILEQLGAIGLLRTASKLGSDTRFHTLADVQRSLEKNMQQLPASIRLEATRALASPRLLLLQQFLAALNHEAGEHLN
ncbi:MAG: HD domain-containing protein [Acidobacteriaceae bacterium]|nr:HD domain-containing protein [Acidobacteriaceae bacterium]